LKNKISKRTAIKNPSLCWPLEAQFVVYVLLPSGDVSLEGQRRTEMQRYGKGSALQPWSSDQQFWADPSHRQAVELCIAFG